MTLNVMQANIQFKGTLRDRQYTKRIVVHHSDSDPYTTVEQIHQWHLNKGWAGIGYHYVIQGGGELWQGRPEMKKGAHAYQDEQHQANTDGIGIVLTGDFEEHPPTEEQLKVLVALIKDLRSRHGELSVIRHSDVMPTACPGSQFPWERLLKMLEGGSMARTGQDIVNEAKEMGLIGSEHNPDDVATKWFVLQVAMNVVKLLRRF